MHQVGGRERRSTADCDQSEKKKVTEREQSQLLLTYCVTFVGDLRGGWLLELVGGVVVVVVIKRGKKKSQDEEQ